MTDQEIMDRIRRLLAEEFEIEPGLLGEESTLYEEMGLDSLDSVDLVVALEKEFGFKIVRSVDEEKIRAIRRLRDVRAFVRGKMPA